MELLIKSGKPNISSDEVNHNDSKSLTLTEDKNDASEDTV
jgi:hypothetical protein